MENEQKDQALQPQAVPPVTVQPQPTPAPVAQPMPSTQPGATQPFNLRDVSDQKDRKRLIKKMLIPSLVLVVIAVGLLFAMNAGLILPNRLKSVTYDNGKGDKFNLKFYAAHTVDKFGSNSGVDTDSKSLIGKKGKGDKLPMGVTIFSSDSASGKVKLYKNNSSCNSGNTVLKAYNNYAQSEVYICSWLTQGSEDYIYLAGFNKDNKTYAAMFMQDVDWTSAKDKSSAQELLKKTGLKPYEEDIKQIVASIKPAQ